MFNRIRISTTLFLILILCGILQIGSNGMSFWAFRDDLQRLNQVDHLSSRVAVFTLEEHEVARHESAQLQIAPVVS
ncbi:hypothetical protein AAG23_000952 [Escherichia coli]|nr:hypothetical protein [Escherichia coli]EFA8850798.1 hypothetical protein [Escherichia coli O177]EEQ6793165.1 hypothetical protein [Escherichia coli]EEU5776804.1 hypothetical protein [Escherichia coli]EEV4973552.1 hypothetical protein [Escherichia coli]